MRRVPLLLAALLISMFCITSHATLTSMLVAYHEGDAPQNSVTVYLRVAQDIHQKPIEYKTYYIALPDASHTAKGNLQFLTQFQPVTENLILFASPNNRIYLVDIKDAHDTSFDNPLQPVAVQQIQTLGIPHPEPRPAPTGQLETVMGARIGSLFSAMLGDQRDPLSPIRISAPFKIEGSEHTASPSCHSLLVAVDGYVFLAKVHNSGAIAELAIEQFHKSGFTVTNMMQPSLEQYCSGIGIVSHEGGTSFFVAADVRNRDTKYRDVNGPFTLDKWNSQQERWETTAVAKVSNNLPIEYSGGAPSLYNTRDMFNLCFGGTCKRVFFQMHRHSNFLLTEPVHNRDIPQKDMTDGRICIKLKLPYSPHKSQKVGRSEEPFKTLVDMAGDNLYCIAAVADGAGSYRMSLAEFHIDAAKITPDNNGDRGYYKEEYAPPQSTLIDRIPLPPKAEGFHQVYDLHKVCDFSQTIRVKHPY